MKNCFTCCTMCGSKQALFQFNQGRQDYYSCPDCNMLFVHKDGHISLHAEMDRYLKHDNSMECHGYVSRFNHLLDISETFFERVNSVLDYGSGPEQVLVQLLDLRGYDARGYDPLFAPVSLEGLVVDCVISTEVFEHLRHPSRELDTIFKIIRPGGYLVVMTELLPRPDKLRKWYYLQDKTHISFFSINTFQWLQDKHPFDLIYSNGRNIVILQKQSV